MFFVYMLASQHYGTLYVGSTNDLARRVWEHKTKALPGFVVKVERQPLELPTFELKQSPEAKRAAEEFKKRPMLGGGPIGSSDK